ncbi:MAG: HNH endonuclease [Sulfuricaulis sp.]|nr:HNH endonuclease [Sulfuricaulis sp.]
MISERRRALKRAWRANNVEKVRAQRRASYRRCEVKRRAYYEEWKKKNLDRCKQHWRNSKARRSHATGQHTAKDIRELLILQKNRCAYCRRNFQKVKVHVDHIIALARGGTNDRKNLQMLCADCNMKKKAKHPIVFAQSLGLLL